MPGLFDWLDSINTGKALELDEQSFKDYVPFQINNGMSQHLDTVLIANEMNKRPWLSKEMQYKFYCGAVIKKKRMGKWAKMEAEENPEDIETISAYYNVNKQVAATYLKIVKPEDLETMRKANFKGGTQTKGRKK